MHRRHAVKKIMVQCCFAVFTGAMLTVRAVGVENDIVNVRGKGVGESESTALKDAYRDAIETAVGMYVDAEQEAKNGHLVKDEILTQSNAYIDGYKLLDKKMVDGLVAVTIEAKVRKQALTKRISGGKGAKTLSLDDSLKDVHAKSTTLSKRDGDGAALLKKELANLNAFAQLYDVSLASAKPVVLKDGGAVAEVAWLFKLDVDRDRYTKEFLPHMERVLKQISVTEPKPFRATGEKYYDKRGGYGPELDDYMADDYAASAIYHDKICADTFRLSSSVFGENDEIHIPGKNQPPYSLSADDKSRTLGVVVVESANKSLTVIKGNAYTLDNASCAVYEAWNNAQMARRCRYSVTFVDGDGEEVSTGIVDFGSYGGLGFEAFWSGYDSNNYVWMITPWAGTNAAAFYKWFKFKIDKDDLPRIKSIKVEFED